MPSQLTRRTCCRLCDSTALELVVPITATPIAGAFVDEARRDEVQEEYPLDMYLCTACGHVQLLSIVDPAELFRDDYSYASGNSPGLVRHFEEYADRVVGRQSPPADSLVVDIGSNDGTFLKFFQQRGLRVLGIEPAEEVAGLARAAGVETLPAFLDQATAEQIRTEYGPAVVVSANNVFAHMDDLQAAARCVRTMLADDGLFVFEVSYLLDVIDHMLLGTIFHEHVSYHSVAPLVGFLQRQGMELIDVRRETIQGGSLICTAQPAGGPKRVDASVAEMLALEQECGLAQPATLQAFSQRLETVRGEVNSTVVDLHEQGRSLAGFGAARGGTLLIYHFGLGEILEYIVDDSPDKQGMFSPGHHIPILPTQKIYDAPPDYLFMLAWVHAKPIIRNHHRYLTEGGRFLIFSPEVRIVTEDDNPFAEG